MALWHFGTLTYAVTSPVFESDIPELRLLGRGKVRDIYAVDDHHLLIVASDRLSAFDVVLPDPIPGKGAVLTALTRFWLHRFEGLVANHASERPLSDVIGDPRRCAELAPRAMLVKRMQPLLIEAVVRGYLIGSGYKDYLSSGSVCGIALPPGLRQADKLPRTLFTPSTKAGFGEHDRNIDFEEAAGVVGAEVAAKVRDTSIRLYEEAAAYAATRGIIIADTKFEFAAGDDGELVLIDEVLTPDSSRFWPADRYSPGSSPPSFDKQFVRDYLETVDWPKRPPAPSLPPEIIAKTAHKYQQAQHLLTTKKGSEGTENHSQLDSRK
ncbi:MAG: phosphoribosylaminoimidazolesuccinocarboxamide synthase [Gammaproteobacteria bacterium]